LYDAGAAQKHETQSGQRSERSFEMQLHHCAVIALYRPPHCVHVT
jgi:hypothetical protein